MWVSPFVLTGWGCQVVSSVILASFPPAAALHFCMAEELLLDSAPAAGVEATVWSSARTYGDMRVPVLTCSWISVRDSCSSFPCSLTSALCLCLFWTRRTSPPFLCLVCRSWVAGPTWFPFFRGSRPFTPTAVMGLPFSPPRQMGFAFLSLNVMEFSHLCAHGWEDLGALPQPIGWMILVGASWQSLLAPDLLCIFLESTLTRFLLSCSVYLQAHTWPLKTSFFFLTFFFWDMIDIKQH